MNALSNSLAFWLALIAGLGVLYVLPTIIGMSRRVERLGIVIGLNFIPVLWPAALIGAVMLPSRRSRYVSTPPDAQGQHVPPPDANRSW